MSGGFNSYDTRRSTPNNTSATGKSDGSEINVLFATGGAHWIPLGQFDPQPPLQWPDPATPPVATFNTTQDAIWTALDRG